MLYRLRVFTWVQVTPRQQPLCCPGTSNRQYANPHGQDPRCPLNRSARAADAMRTRQGILFGPANPPLRRIEPNAFHFTNPTNKIDVLLEGGTHDSTSYS